MTLILGFEYRKTSKLDNRQKARNTPSKAYVGIGKFAKMNIPRPLKSNVIPPTLPLLSIATESAKKLIQAGIPKPNETPSIKPTNPTATVFEVSNENNSRDENTPRIIHRVRNLLRSIFFEIMEPNRAERIRPEK
ncbi:MAG TPA: hypothetical protein VMD05_01285 [Candidatus Nanoarchaeia archaeon]|nr:hypothetical protein [Candidatus Nanoarchaeia archaeon]